MSGITSKNNKTYRMVICAMFAALICVLAPFSIPMPGGIPLSLATFPIMLAGCLEGPVSGTVSVFIYLLLGLTGLPVFSGMRSGPAVLFGMTGGFLIGYLALSFLCGLIYFTCLKKAAKSPIPTFVILVSSMICGTIALYVLGTAWFMILTGNPLRSALLACVIPFLPGDLVKIVSAALIVPILSSRIRFR